MLKQIKKLNQLTNYINQNKTKKIIKMFLN